MLVDALLRSEKAADDKQGRGKERGVICMDDAKWESVSRVGRSGV